MMGLSKVKKNMMGDMRFFICLAWILTISLFFGAPALSSDMQGFKTWTGRGVMNEVFKRHEFFPYVFEQQTMILMDSAGNRDVRKVRRFSRVERDGTVKFLLVFDNPEEVRGVALLATRNKSGQGESGVYLPALGKEIRSSAGQSRGSLFLGTDFAVEDLTAEVLSDFRYIRVADHVLDKTEYFVLEAYPQDEEIERTTGYSLRRHYVRKDNFFIVRTDYFGRRGRLFKRQTSHDLKRLDGDMWRANMILMENFKENHKTLLKIDQRIFSRDYVPPEIFTADWLLNNRHILDTEKLLMQEALRSPDGAAVKAPKDPGN